MAFFQEYTVESAIVSGASKLILLVDGSSCIISSEKLDYFCAVSNTVPSHINKLFTAYKLTINLDKTNIIQCRMSHSLQYLFITM
jgi:hypothetical protein